MADYYFVDLPDIGNLTFKESFLDFEDDEIFFICETDEHEEYFCFQFEMRFRREWLVVKLDNNLLSKMLHKEIPMRDALIQMAQLWGNHFLYVIMYLDGSEDKRYVTFDDSFLNKRLPKENIYFFGDI